MTTTASKNPLYPDAPPTSPGGMSRKALVAEMVTKHGYENDKDAWAQVSWPDLIEMVIAERQDREAEQVKPEQIMSDIMDNSPEFAEAVGNMLAVETIEDAVLAASDMFDLLEDEDEPDGVIDLGVLYAELSDEEKAAAHDGAIFTEVLPEETAEAVLPDGADDEGIIDPEVMFAEMTAVREANTPPPVFIGIPGIKDYIFDNHAGAGPSGAERWMNCTMSLTASRKFLETLSPNQQAHFAGANTAARQGTTAHNAAEVEANLMLGRLTQEEVDYVLMELSIMPEEGEVYDEEMAEYITEYTDLVKSYAQERGDDHVLIEHRGEAAIPLTDLHEGEVYIVRGSADLVVLPLTKGDSSGKTLVVGDLKYGNGIDVDVDENPQIRIYALAVLALLVDDEGNLPAGLEDVVYHIIQPRLGGIKTWTESIDDLLAWRDDVLAPALTKALYGANEGATFEPSELACQFCPARGGCPALTEQRVEAAAGLFEVIVDSEFTDGPGSFPETTTLSDDRLGELLAQVAGLKNIYNDLKEEAQRRLHRGDAVPGYWLVNYSPNREWKPGADEALADVPEVWTDPTPVLRSPAQAEKALSKEQAAVLTPLIHKPDKRPVISTGPGDKRSKWEGKPPEAMFAVETGDE